MIPMLIGAGISLASGIAGGIKSAKAAKEQKKLINEQERKNQEWYNKNYYQNYLDSAEAQAAMNRVEKTLQRQNQEARAAAAVTGATPEAALAQQEANNQLLADTAAGLAAQGTQRKAQIDAVNQQNQNVIAQQRMGQAAANEAGGASIMNSGLGLIGSALSLYDTDKKKGV